MTNARDNLDAGKYENKVPWSVEKIPVDENTMTVRQAREHQAAEKERVHQQLRLHRENEGRMTALLQADLEIEHGVAGHPRAGKVWELAWEHGHSGGYGSVIHYYEEFVQLIQEVAA